MLRILPTETARGGRSLVHMCKSAAREAKAGTYHHGLALNERALSLVRRPSRAGGPIPTAWRGAHARQARVLRLLPTESARGGCSLAHMHKSAALEAKVGVYHHGSASNERGLSLARWPSKAKGPIQTRAAWRAWRARAASARAAPPPHRERAWWPLSCAHAQVGRARGQGRRVSPRHCTEREIPVACAPVF